MFRLAHSLPSLKSSHLEGRQKKIEEGSGKLELILLNSLNKSHLLSLSLEIYFLVLANHRNDINVDKRVY
jgi:hypothetical protein